MVDRRSKQQTILQRSYRMGKLSLAGVRITEPVTDWLNVTIVPNSFQ